MLLHLNIQNFAIVRSLDIDWHKGMTTITGETGAGKSIAIGALELCLGERALTNVVRPGCKKAELVASFDVHDNPLAKKWLSKHELVIDNECLLRRVIFAEGRSKAYINGSPVPLVQLKELGHLLLNIHGQHDHQLITKATEQRRLLDSYANHNELLTDVKYYHKQWRQLLNELKQKQDNQSQQEAKRQLLQYQVTELDEFALQPQEFETLENDYKRFSNVQDILHETLKGIQLLAEDEQFNVADSLGRICDNLTALANLDSSLANISGILGDALIQVQDAHNDLRHYYEQLEVNPEAYAAIETRYSLALQLAKKHQVAPENLAVLHGELTKELAVISSDESRLLGLIDEIEQAKQSYFDAAGKLSASRKGAATILNELISQNMQELNMPYGQFCIEITTQAVTDEKLLAPHGIDDINFLVSINNGQPLELMHKVASGGELSRISLAIQVILADNFVTPTLIFDEVDVGISGPTAAKVGKKLQQLAKNTQVICITHLPQVASKGHQQLFVAKSTDGQATETTITELNPESRIKEIARLLAGDSITEFSLANAQELLAS